MCTRAHGTCTRATSNGHCCPGRGQRSRTCGRSRKPTACRRTPGAPASSAFASTPSTSKPMPKPSIGSTARPAISRTTCCCKTRSSSSVSQTSPRATTRKTMTTLAATPTALASATAEMTRCWAVARGRATGVPGVQQQTRHALRELNRYHHALPEADPSLHGGPARVRWAVSLGGAVRAVRRVSGVQHLFLAVYVTPDAPPPAALVLVSPCVWLISLALSVRRLWCQCSWCTDRSRASARRTVRTSACTTPRTRVSSTPGTVCPNDPVYTAAESAGFGFAFLLLSLVLLLGTSAFGAAQSRACFACTWVFGLIAASLR